MIQRSNVRVEGADSGGRIMDELVLDGRLDVESQYAKPVRDRGRLLLSESRVTWEIPRFLGGRTDSASWWEMHTFGRDGKSLHIARAHRFEGPGELLALLRFDSDLNSCTKAVNVARLHLSRENWRTDWQSPDSRLDEVWTRDWGPEPAKDRGHNVDPGFLELQR
jgi:hypothetical protein